MSCDDRTASGREPPRSDHGLVYLVRHGRTALNADGRLRGRLDPPLDQVGLVEVERLAASLASANVCAVLTSPLSRAVRTAAAIAEQTGVAATPDSRLLDRDYGTWAGEREADVVQRWGSLDAAPGVELAGALRVRVRAVLDEQIPLLGDGNVVLVAHDAVNRSLLADIDPTLGAIGQRTACWNVIALTPHRPGPRWRVDLVDHKEAAPEPIG